MFSELNSHQHSLRPRRHNFSLSIKTDDRNLLVRQLFADSYWCSFALNFYSIVHSCVLLNCLIKLMMMMMIVADSSIARRQYQTFNKWNHCLTVTRLVSVANILVTCSQSHLLLLVQADKDLAQEPAVHQQEQLDKAVPDMAVPDTAVPDTAAVVAGDIVPDRLEDTVAVSTAVDSLASPVPCRPLPLQKQLLTNLKSFSP